jgi:hypothetical protein
MLWMLLRYINKEEVAIGILSSLQQNFDTILFPIRATPIMGGNGCIYQNVPFMNADEMKTHLYC